MSEPARSTTERGFVIYDEFTDTYGHGIRVQQSSGARTPCCWIFVSVDEALGDRPSPHLDVEQAKRLRDALDVFVREQET